MGKGWIRFVYGTMNSGKSLHLLATAHNFQERGIAFIILKSSIDNRDGEGVVHSRALGDKECINIETTTNIFKMIELMESMTEGYSYKGLQWILVDEAQFLTPKQVDELAKVADTFGINILCYGLRTDFQTHLFPGSKRLFEIADGFEEIKSSCSCGCKTLFNARIDSEGNIVTDGEQIEVGGDDRYISLCRKCYMKGIEKPLVIDDEE